MDIHNTGNASGVEIVNCIKEAGITPDITDLSQLVAAVKLLGGLSREEIQAMIDEAASRTSPYWLCEFYFFRHPALRPGFQPAHGDLLENAATLYPEAWAYLQTTEGQLLCKTEEEWQAMTHAIWHTNADGSTVGWDGIGGAPFYALHLDTGALRLPDIRGMYAEAAGFDSLGVGGVHGDFSRRVTGAILPVFINNVSAMLNNGGSGALFSNATGENNQSSATYQSLKGDAAIRLDTGRVGPVGNKNAPRAWGALACVYLGQPAS